MSYISPNKKYKINKGDFVLTKFNLEKDKFICNATIDENNYRFHIFRIYDIEEKFSYLLFNYGETIDKVVSTHSLIISNINFYKNQYYITSILDVYYRKSFYIIPNNIFTTILIKVYSFYLKLTI